MADRRFALLISPYNIRAKIGFRARVHCLFYVL